MSPAQTLIMFTSTVFLLRSSIVCLNDAIWYLNRHKRMISVTCFAGLNLTINVNVETGDFCHTLTRFMWCGVMLLGQTYLLQSQAVVHRQKCHRDFFFQMYLKLDLCYLEMNWEFWRHWKIIRIFWKEKTNFRLLYYNLKSDITSIMKPSVCIIAWDFAVMKENNRWSS